MSQQKRIIQILDEMTLDEVNGDTCFVSMCPEFIGLQKTKQGGHCTMGVPENVLLDIMSGKTMPILLLVNKEEYFKRVNHDKKK